MKYTDTLTKTNFHIFDKVGPKIPIRSNAWAAWSNYVFSKVDMRRSLVQTLFLQNSRSNRRTAAVPAPGAQIRSHCNYDNSKIVKSRHWAGGNLQTPKLCPLAFRKIPRDDERMLLIPKAVDILAQKMAAFRRYQ